MVKRWCTQAVSATFFGFPAAKKRAEQAVLTGWWRTATSAAMEQTARTRPRPPHTSRLPRRVPLSRLSGATSTSAAICVRPERAHLRHRGQQGDGHHRPHPRRAAPPVLVRPPPQAWACPGSTGHRHYGQSWPE